MDEDSSLVILCELPVVVRVPRELGSEEAECLSMLIADELASKTTSLEQRLRAHGHMVQLGIDV